MIKSVGILYLEEILRLAEYLYKQMVQVLVSSIYSYKKL